MDLSRRRFMGAVAVSSMGLVAPRALAAVDTSALPSLLPRALAALETHHARIEHRDAIGIVDFSAPSRQPRFHLVNVVAGRIERSWLVAHGSGSDPGNSGWLQHFSNTPGSNASSRGAYLTAASYHGKHGRSRRMHGLDAENSRAFARDIVIHGASYVDRGLAESIGRIGRSQGCFAVQTREIDEVLARLGPGRLIFAAK